MNYLTMEDQLHDYRSLPDCEAMIACAPNIRGGIKLIRSERPGWPAEDMARYADSICRRYDMVALLGNTTDSGLTLVVGVSQNLVDGGLFADDFLAKLTNLMEGDPTSSGLAVIARGSNNPGALADIFGRAEFALPAMLHERGF